MVAAARAHGLVGVPQPRVGGPERVTGRQEYLADIRLENMLYVKLVGIDRGHARILSVDVSRAWEVPGVVDIVSAADLPQPVARFGPVYADRPIIAVDDVNFHGEPVVAVAAETKVAAELAASLVEIEFEELPGVYDMDTALRPDAPLVQSPDLRKNDILAATNILRERRYGWGDVDQEASAAELVLEHTYTFPMVTHFAIEPHGFIVAPDGDGLVMWSPVQHPYLLQRMMADLFALPLNKVRVFAPDPGGGFGGKQNPKFEPLLGHLALRTGRPCRLVLTLEETFQAARRAAATVHVRSGFRSDGTLVFHDIESNFLIGAYADIAERVVAKANYLAAGPYRVPAVRIISRAVLSHTTPSCAFRGFGTPQINWAIESQLSEAARQLGLDDLQLRLTNLVRRGEAMVPGDVPADGEWAQTARLVAEAVGWAQPPAEGRGRGLAFGIKSGATTGLSYSTVRYLFDGSVIVYAGTSDMGQGARTIFAQLAAEQLGASMEKVSVVMGDTAVVPFDLQTSASRSTVFMGNAIMRACADIHRQLVELAADVLDADPSEIVVEGGALSVQGRRIPFVDIAQRGLGRLRGELIGNGSYRKKDMPEHPLGGDAAFYEFNCTAFEVEVDAETGEILMHKHVTGGDVGTALNPLQVEMQDEGASIMGLGHALMEHIVIDPQGRIRNLGALDYRIPTTKDVPLSLEALMVENHDGPGPYGAKGVSEGGLLCTASALASAVTNATGVVFRDLPLTPERVWRGIQQTRDEARA